MSTSFGGLQIKPGKAKNPALCRVPDMYGYVCVAMYVWLCMIKTDATKTFLLTFPRSQSYGETKGLWIN